MTENREPVIFAQGDTLQFQRYLRNYLPSDGWSLLYEIRSAVQPALPPIEILSTPDATNTNHEILVTPDVTALWQPGDAVLVGYVVNVSGERHQFYEAELNLTPDLGTDANTVDVTTHAQRMIPLLECALEQLAKNVLQETNVQQVQVLRIKRMDLERQLALNKEIRFNEVAAENVANGRPSGFKIRPQLNVIAGSSPFGNNWPIA